MILYFNNQLNSGGKITMKTKALFRSEFFNGTVLTDDQLKDKELKRCQNALKYIKSKFHPYVRDFLKDDLAQTTSDMERYASESNGKWKSGYVDVIMPGITWEEYHDWFMNKIKTNDELALQVAHPDHYLNEVTDTGPPARVNIIENLGEDNLPWFILGTFVDASKMPSIFQRNSDYPEDFCLECRSSNGVLVCYAVHEFKNCENNNCNIRLTIILPEKAPDRLIVGHLNHFSVEFRNWYLAALEAL